VYKIMFMIIECKYVRDLFKKTGIEYISEQISVSNVGIE
jgi:hypothetical protein